LPGLSTSDNTNSRGGRSEEEEEEANVGKTKTGVLIRTINIDRANAKNLETLAKRSFLGCINLQQTKAISAYYGNTQIAAQPTKNGKGELDQRNPTI
jgi:hypothetical protein